GMLDICSFFFSSRRRHTRCYRDWSSDVCSSDLDGKPAERLIEILRGRGRARPRDLLADERQRETAHVGAAVLLGHPDAVEPGLRSEERRVGKECRTRWAPVADEKQTSEHNREVM